VKVEQKEHLSWLGDLKELELKEGSFKELAGIATLF